MARRTYCVLLYLDLITSDSTGCSQRSEELDSRSVSNPVVHEHRSAWLGGAVPGMRSEVKI